MGMKTYSPERLPDARGQGVVSLRIWNLHRKLNLHLFANKLGDLYKPLVMTGRVVFRINGREVRPTPVPVAARSIVPLYIPFEPKRGCPLCPSARAADGSQSCPRCGVPYVITGWVGRLEANSRIRGGLRCFSLGRMIATHEYFGHPDAIQRPVMNLLYGEAYFDFVPMILNKTDYQREGEPWTAVYEGLHQQIKPVVRSLLDRETDEEVPLEELEQADQASRLIRRALRAVSRPLPEVPSWRPRSDVAGNRSPSLIAPSQGVTKNKHKANRSGLPTRSRESGRIQIEVKSFDAALRSALVERDGRQVLVINRSFPAYRLAGGGLAYLLETACLEWARRESTGQESAVELIDRAVKLLGESSHIALTRSRQPLL
jgi:hypothetical protein